jgi:hypothetical protein
MAKKLKATGPVEKVQPIALTPAPKRGRAAKPVEPPRTYTAAQKQEARERLELAHDELLSLQGQMRNKAGQVAKLVAECAKIQTVSKKTLRWGLENRKRDAAEIDMETKERNRVAQFFGLKLGTQLGLFEGPEGTTSLATQIEIDANAAKGGKDLAGSQTSIDSAKHQGKIDGERGDYKNAFDEGSPEFLAYDAEYKAAQIKLAAGPASESSGEGEGADAADEGEKLEAGVATVKALRAKLPKKLPAAAAATAH